LSEKLCSSLELTSRWISSKTVSLAAWGSTLNTRTGYELVAGQYILICTGLLTEKAQSDKHQDIPYLKKKGVVAPRKVSDLDP